MSNVGYFVEGGENWYILSEKCRMLEIEEWIRQIIEYMNELHHTIGYIVLLFTMICEMTNQWAIETLQYDCVTGIVSQ